MTNFITIKDIIEEDFINYKKPAMFIVTSTCSFKCEKEDCNVKCQNSKITKLTNKKINIDIIIDKYTNNPITKSVVFGGLEPIDQLNELLEFIKQFRKNSKDDIVIYTGYTEEELLNQHYDKKSIIEIIKEHNCLYNKGKLIIKYGRFKSSSIEKYDDVLGITLASNNQYAKEYN